MDFQFRVGLDPEAESSSPQEPPQVAMVRGLLRAILETVVLTVEGRDVRVDGFRLDPDPTVHPLWPTG